MNEPRGTQIERTRSADERAKRVYRERTRGQTFKAISAELGISTAWAREIFERGRDVIRSKNDPLNELSTRVRNVIREENCGQTPAEISRWFAAQSANYIRTIPNIGAGSREELRQWLVRHGQQPLKEIP